MVCDSSNGFVVDHLLAAELASSQLQQEQLLRDVKQLKALAAEKDDRLSEAAKVEQQLRQQLGQLQQQMQDAGELTHLCTACWQATWLMY